MKKLLFVLAIIFATSAVVAEDAFIDDALGADAVLPEGVISDAAGIDLGGVGPVELNSDSEYVDVMNMDISGAMLGMPFEDIQTLFFKTKTLYSPIRRNSIVYTMANDWRYNLDYECREQGISAPEKIDKCVVSLAKARGLLYPSELHLERKSTGETIDIYFTSNATDNTVWKIVYKNDVNNLEGASEKFANQREKKILAFWESVLDKYGAPNSENDKWISSDNSFDPKMTAYYGRLELTDLGLYGRDATKNVQESKSRFKPRAYSF